MCIQNKKTLLYNILYRFNISLQMLNNIIIYNIEIVTSLVGRFRFLSMLKTLSNI